MEKRSKRNKRNNKFTILIERAIKIGIALVVLLLVALFVNHFFIDNGNQIDDSNSNKIKANQDNIEEKVIYDKENNIYIYYTKGISRSDLSGSKSTFWVSSNADHSRPKSPISISKATKLSMYYIGSDDESINLTFNEDSDVTHAKETLDILEKNNVKAIFFLSKEFMNNNKELVKEIANKGYLCGNLSSKSDNMVSLAKTDPGQFLKNVIDNEELFYEITGMEMSKLYRTTDGEYSEILLDYLKQLNYKTLFWSFAYKDWNKEYNTKEIALKKMIDSYHRGAIYLLHDVNDANILALDDFIKSMVSDEHKYIFKTPSYIVADIQN